MKDSLNKTLKYALSVFLAAIFLWFSFREVEWADFFAGLKECRWGWVLLSISLGAFAFWLRSLRWRQLLRPIDSSITRLTAFNGINIGNISNFVFPRIGEFVRCGVITRRSRPVSPSQPDVRKASYEKVLGTVVLERGWELLVMLLMLALVLLFGFERFGQFFVERIWVPMALKFGSNIWWGVLALAAAGVAGVYMVWHFRDSNTFCRKVWGVARGVGQGFSSCLKMDRKWLFFAYTALIWLTYWSMAAATVKAAPFLNNLDHVDALFLSLIGGLGFAVPVPGGIGAFHFIISMTLSVMYGVPVELGVVYATISHTSQAITQILFGLGSYAYEAFKK